MFSPLPFLSGAERAAVLVGSFLFRVVLFLCALGVSAGSWVVIENPQDPGHPHPSFWASWEVQEWLEQLNGFLLSFDQCCFGACVKKATSILTNDSAALSAIERLRCFHGGHPPLPVLPSGYLDTAPLARYPEGLSAAFAAAAVRWALSSRTPGTPWSPGWAQGLIDSVQEVAMAASRLGGPQL